MGNPMTPFVPPAATFIPSIVNILASTAVANIITLTNAQALNEVLYISGTATNSSVGPYIYFPTNSPAKVYTFCVDAVTTGTTGNVMAAGHVGGGTVISFYPSLTWQFTHFPSGIGGAYFFRASATNITFP